MQTPQILQKTGSVNYVIATWAGKNGSICRNKLTKVYPHPKDYLREHLKQLTKIKHNLAQITIMKAAVSSGTPKYNDYYNVDDLVEKIRDQGTVVEFVDCPNFGLSYGQYFEAYQKYRGAFDYYCFIEDDYTVAMDHFDRVLVGIYTSKFPNEIGFLCSWAPKLKNVKFHAAYEFGLISSKTLDTLYNKWPRPSDAFKNLSHGEIQVKYSDLFLENGINVKDYTDLYATPYYKGVHKKLINCSKKPESNDCIFIPIQMLKNYSKAFNKKLPLHKWLLS